MAKEIRWTDRAIVDRTNIYKYWFKHNKSDTYSERLETLFKKSSKLISVFPQIGKQTEYRGVYVKIIKNYKIFYRIKPKEIVILRVWDSRQHPDSRNV